MELIIDFIVTTGIVIDSIILFFLFKKDNKELPQKILIVLFMFMLIELVITYIFLHQIYLIDLFSIIFSSAITWFLGPLIYLYIKSIVDIKDNLIKKNLIHFIPYIVYIFFKLIVLFYLQPDLHKSTYEEIFKKKWIADVVISNLYFIVYLLLALREFYQYKKAIMSNFSNLTRHDFLWIEHMLIGYLAIISIDTIISVAGLYSIYGFYITITSMVIVIIYLGYYGINQSKLLLPDFLIREDFNIEDSMEKSNKHQLSNQSTQEIDDLRIRLENVLKDDRPYLDEDLTLRKLAEMIPTSDKKLSTLLNKYMDISFYDIINKHRVEAVKEKIISQNYQKYSLLGIAYDCGFSSKSSFIRIFKKETGLSPSEFKKKY